MIVHVEVKMEGSKYEKCDNFIEILRTTLANEYCDVAKRMRLSRVPQCIKDPMFCAKFHRKKDDSNKSVSSSLSFDAS